MVKLILNHYGGGEGMVMMAQNPSRIHLFENIPSKMIVGKVIYLSRPKVKRLGLKIKVI